MIEKIKTLLENKNTKSYGKLLKNNPDLYNFVMNQVKQFNPASINEALYILLVSPPEIKPCGKYPLFNTYDKGYRQFCGSKSTCECARLNQSEKIKIHSNTLTSQEKQTRLLKQKKTSLERYGVENPAQSKEVQDKIKQTNNERYGVDFPLQSLEIKDKIKQTNNERYGVDFPLQSLEIKDKIKQTNNERYGSDSCKHARDTFLKNNNGKNPFVVYRDKVKNTLLQNYGVEHSLQNETIYNRAVTTFQEKYNRENPAQIHISEDSYRILKDKNKFFELCNNNSINEVCDRLNVSLDAVRSWHDRYQFDIYSKKVRSRYEEEIAQWLTSNEIEFTRNARIHDKTVDFLIGSIAIEFNGLYTHSENSHYGKKLGMNKNYHANKWKQCKKQGIQLITIFEDEWNDRKESIKRKILILLGKGQIGTPARKLSVQLIQKEESNQFLDTYHIQGKCRATVYLGAYDNDQLVAVMTFIRLTETEFELNRFASDDKIHSGAFSKLLKHFEKIHSPTKIISFADHRYSNGNVYESNGFTLKNTIPPDYSVTNYTVREHKFNWRKSRIGNRFNVCVENKTEKQLTYEVGWDRIWDCGKSKYVK